MKAMESREDMLRLTTVARRIDVSEHTIRSWIKQKLLPATQIRRRWYIKPIDLENFLNTPTKHQQADAP